MVPAFEPITISTGEQILFWILAVSMVIVAFYGLLIARKAVYTIISVIFVMVGLAFFYTMLEAPFMGVVQVVVYTGAILMMFLFVLMLIGIDSADSTHDNLIGQRVVAAVGAIGVFALLSVILLRKGTLAQYGDQSAIPVGLEEVNAKTNPVAVAESIFTNHVLTLELTGVLLIVAAIGAMTLTHRDRVKPKKTQEQIAHEKVQAFTADGANMNVLPNSGVYAESNSSTNTSLTVYGKPVKNSVNRVLKIRHQDRTVVQISPVTAARIAAGDVPSGPSTYGVVTTARAFGMPGEGAPSWDEPAAVVDAPTVPAADPAAGSSAASAGDSKESEAAK